MELKPVACKEESCKAEMVWVTVTRQDGEKKRMPLDFEPVPQGSWLISDHEQDDRGGPVAEFVPKAQRAEHRGELRTSHFATCTRADKFQSDTARRRKPARQ